MHGFHWSSGMISNSPVMNRSLTWCRQSVRGPDKSAEEDIWSSLWSWPCSLAVSRFLSSCGRITCELQEVMPETADLLILAAIRKVLGHPFSVQDRERRQTEVKQTDRARKRGAREFAKSGGFPRKGAKKQEKTVELLIRLKYFILVIILFDEKYFKSFLYVKKDLIVNFTTIRRKVLGFLFSFELRSNQKAFILHLWGEES